MEYTIPKQLQQRLKLPPVYLEYLERKAKL